MNVDASRVIRTVAGLRPYRRSGFVVRREALGEKSLVHNYGHGGSGITLSWGSSRLATNLGLPGHSGAVAVLGGMAAGYVLNGRFDAASRTYRRLTAAGEFFFRHLPRFWKQ